VDPGTLYWTDGREPPARGGSVAELLALPRREQEQLRVVTGHMPFGLHQQLPWPETWHYVTFVRNPLSRTVSEYYHVRETPRNPAHAAGLEYNLEEFVRRGLGLSENGMCRSLSGECYGQRFTSPQAMFQEAVRNADSCSFVGLTEAYTESVRRLCRLCGWQLPVVEPRHKSTPPGRTLSNGERAIISARNELDWKLYRYLRDRFLSLPEEPRSPLMRLWDRWISRRVPARLPHAVES